MQEKTQNKDKGRKWDGRSRPSNDLYKKNYDEIFKKDFLEESEKEKKKLEESYQESVRQARERKWSDYFFLGQV